MRRLSYPLQLLLLLLFQASLVNAQSVADKGCKPPISRVRWHDDIDKAQKKLVEQKINAGDNEELNYFVTQAIIKHVDAVQCRIETDAASKEQQKIGYLRGLESLLKNFSGSYRSRQVMAAQFPVAIDAYENAVGLDKKGESLEGLIEKSAYEVGRLVVGSGAFDKNSGMRAARFHLVYKNIELHPDKTFSILKDNSDVPFRDSLIKIAAYKNTRQLYDYAAADNKLGYAIRAIDDPLIRAVSKMAKSSSGQLYFPFLDNILRGSQTLEEIDAVKADPVKYYKLLVKTKMEYVQRKLEGEEIKEMKALEAMLNKKALESFIIPINELHETDNLAVRFKALTVLNAQELYYLVIAGETDLYTSSYVKGVYPQMMQKIGARGDSLFISVGFDHFKKFIKIAAGYNTLPNFLATFPDNTASKMLMTAFVNGLDKSIGLEDGVDVADSYASISETLKPLSDEMLANVKHNYDEALQNNNKRGGVIYGLLYKLFQSATDTTINLSKEFGIPPVYSVNYNSLVSDSSGKVITQVFFYGDKDARIWYADFLNHYPSSVWKRSDTKQWVSFSSLKGKPVTVYANKPLDEQSGEVDRAQAGLCQYLSENNLSPSVIIHRGHSYFAPYTIDQIPTSAKIVFLGSCGGYHLIHDVLAHAEDAHIIASKQIGQGNINQPFFDLLNEKLRVGSNIDWIPFWNEFKKKTGPVEGFGDYIPPHKNLGAIFIKAYKNAMGDSGEGI